MSNTINAQVAERIKSCAPEVETQLVDLMVSKEISRRVELIGQGLAKSDQMTRERFKLAKPTNVALDINGNVVSESYSKEALETLKKHDEKAAKLENALEKALAGDLSKLPDLLK
jgi:hypothetical protein